MAEPEQGSVEARINVKAMTVTLKGEQPNLRAEMTFRVQGGSRVKWKLRDANGNPTGLRAQVRFDRPLFENRNTFEGTGTIDSEKVDRAADPPDPLASSTAAVEYRYHFNVETSPGKFDEVKCSWTDGSRTAVTGMGGGEKGPRP